MLYLSVRPAGTAPATPPPTDVGHAALQEALERAPGAPYQYAANAPLPPYRPHPAPVARRWRLRIAVPALWPSLRRMMKRFGAGAASAPRQQGPATREELSTLFSRELQDFARARPQRRR